jgi:hypothetical protein
MPAPQEATTSAHRTDFGRGAPPRGAPATCSPAQPSLKRPASNRHPRPGRKPTDMTHRAGRHNAGNGKHDRSAPQLRRHDPEAIYRQTPSPATIDGRGDPRSCLGLHPPLAPRQTQRRRTPTNGRARGSRIWCSSMWSFARPEQGSAGPVPAAKAEAGRFASTAWPWRAGSAPVPAKVSRGDWQDRLRRSRHVVVDEQPVHSERRHRRQRVGA